MKYNETGLMWNEIIASVIFLNNKTLIYDCDLYIITIWNYNIIRKQMLKHYFCSARLTDSQLNFSKHTFTLRVDFFLYILRLSIWSLKCLSTLIISLLYIKWALIFISTSTNCNEIFYHTWSLTRIEFRKYFESTIKAHLFLFL